MAYGWIRTRAIWCCRQGCRNHCPSQVSLEKNLFCSKRPSLFYFSPSQVLRMFIFVRLYWGQKAGRSGLEICQFQKMTSHQFRSLQISVCLDLRLSLHLPTYVLRTYDPFICMFHVQVGVLLIATYNMHCFSTRLIYILFFYLTIHLSIYIGLCTHPSRLPNRLLSIFLSM